MSLQENKLCEGWTIRDPTSPPIYDPERSFVVAIWLMAEFYSCKTMTSNTLFRSFM